MKIPETEQNTEEFQELIAMRTRSNTKRQSRSKEVIMSDQTTTSAPSSETCRDLYDQKQINGSKLMMMETQRGDDSDPENTKFQYLFDSLQQEFQQQLKLVEQRTCENRNNLLLLIEWLSLIINRMVIAG
uniref:Uncharacterized protein n=1 Tax=Wuchereria bancrofti TaxID=6293 RepID=A0AAF5Q740_WUCBA